MMRVPTVDVAEIGNGAGSIAYVDAGGLICVGPISAGAAPGPACYGAGGDKPTVTDANLVLGFLPDRLAGGVADPRCRQGARRRSIAMSRQPLGLSVEEAAFGIRAIANANMARAIRAVTVERGVDPRDFKLLAFGGSGPDHACDLARILNVPEVMFPPAPGVFTAMGMLAGAIEHFLIRGIHRPLDRIAVADLTGRHRRARPTRRSRELAARGHGREAVGLRFEIDLRFTGQDSEVQVGFDPDRLDDELGDTAAALPRALPGALWLRLERRRRGRQHPADRHGRGDRARRRPTSGCGPGRSDRAAGHADGDAADLFRARRRLERNAGDRARRFAGDGRTAGDRERRHDDHRAAGRRGSRRPPPATSWWRSMSDAQADTARRRDRSTRSPSRSSRARSTPSSTTWPGR